MSDKPHRWETPTLTRVDISDCNVAPGNQIQKCNQKGVNPAQQAPCCRVKPGCARPKFPVQS